MGLLSKNTINNRKVDGPQDSSLDNYSIDFQIIIGFQPFTKRPTLLNDMMEVLCAPTHDSLYKFKQLSSIGQWFCQHKPNRRSVKKRVLKTMLISVNQRRDNNKTKDLSCCTCA